MQITSTLVFLCFSSSTESNNQQATEIQTSAVECHSYAVLEQVGNTEAKSIQEMEGAYDVVNEDFVVHQLKQSQQPPPPPPSQPALLLQTSSTLLPAESYNPSDSADITDNSKQYVNVNKSSTNKLKPEGALAPPTVIVACYDDVLPDDKESQPVQMKHECADQLIRDRVETSTTGRDGAYMDNSLDTAKLSALNSLENHTGTTCTGYDHLPQHLSHSYCNPSNPSTQSQTPVLTLQENLQAMSEALYDSVAQ